MPMQKRMDGALKLAVLMLGVKFTTHTMIKNAVAGSFALPAFGVHPKMQTLMLNKSDELLIIAAPKK